MKVRLKHLTVVIGTAAIAEDLRRTFTQRGIEVIGVASHLRGLRKCIVMNKSDLVIICIAMDRATLSRHGRSLGRLLADCHTFSDSIRSVGLLSGVGPLQEIAMWGCDVYVQDVNQAVQAVHLLARSWRRQQAARKVSIRPFNRPELSRAEPVSLSRGVCTGREDLFASSLSRAKKAAKQRSCQVQARIDEGNYRVSQRQNRLKAFD